MNVDDVLPHGAEDGDAVTPLLAATVIICRDAPFRVLMMRRHEDSSFVPDAWVFPGGVLDDADVSAAQMMNLPGSDVQLTALRICAVRELLEETGLWLGAEVVDATTLRGELRHRRSTMEPHVRALGALEETLVLTSRWITPVGVPKRFDTFFFVAPAPSGDATEDRTEAAEVRWIAPREALRLHAAGEFTMVFPTIRNLEAIAGISDTAALLEARRGAEVVPVRPLLVSDGKRKKIVLPGE